MKSETERHELLNILKAAVVYFALVFGAGFILGPIRILFIVPRFGVRQHDDHEHHWKFHQFGQATAPRTNRMGVSSLPPGAKTL
jgi:hypothetical protein